MSKPAWATNRPVINSKEIQLLTFLRARPNDYTEVIDISKRCRITHGESSELLYKLARKNLIISNGNGYKITKPGLEIL